MTGGAVNYRLRVTGPLSNWSGGSENSVKMHNRHEMWPIYIQERPKGRKIPFSGAKSLNENTGAKNSEAVYRKLELVKEVTHHTWVRFDRNTTRSNHTEIRCVLVKPKLVPKRVQEFSHWVGIFRTTRKFPGYELRLHRNSLDLGVNPR
ncbi:hypothetical protein DFH06DRAFT_1141621 [Mycena polygramma]|nr:hypothetical protein DFH06DRAFT_1141621 [Mycena polygramma]